MSPNTPPAWMQFAPFIFMMVVMYFLMIRPQVKRQKTHQEFVTGLKRGDQVLTSSGIYGRIEGITDQFVTLEVADGVRLKILKTQIAGPASAVGAEARS
jgi:preprotein translocase subunit YajC